MTFWIIVAVIILAALVVLILSICKVSGDADRAMAKGRASVAGREKWEERMKPYFNDELDMEWEDER